MFWFLNSIPMEEASINMMLTHRAPPTSTPRGPVVATTPLGSPRDTPFEQATLHPHHNLNILKQHPARWSAAHVTRRRWTWNCSGTLSVPRHVPAPKQAHAKAKLFSRCIRTDADIKPSKTPITTEKTENSHPKLFVPNAQLTMAVVKQSWTPSQIESTTIAPFTSSIARSPMRRREEAQLIECDVCVLVPLQCALAGETS